MKKSSIFLAAMLSCLRLFPQAGSVRDSVPKIIGPIPVAEVTAQSATVTAMLLEKALMLYSSEDRSEVRSAIDDIVSRVSELSESQAGKDLNELQYRELENSRRIWKNLLERLEIHQKSLTNEARKLEDEKSLVSEMKTRWDLTLSLAHERRAPRTVTDRINSTEREISAYSQSVGDNLNFILIQLDRIGQQVILVNQLLADIDNAVTQKSRNILSFDSRPLWEELHFRKDTAAVLIKNENMIPRIISDIKELFRDFRIILIINLLLLVFILITFFYLLTNLSRYISKDATLTTPIKKLAHRPLSAGFLVGLAVSYTLYGDAPESIRTMISMVLLIPLTIIIDEVLPSWFKKPVLLLIILDFLVRLYDLASQGAIFSRLYLLLVTSFAIGLVYWLISIKKSRERIKGTPRGQVKYYLLILSLAILILSFFANILGAVLFSGLMVTATIVSIISMFLIYTLFFTADGLIMILLKSSYFSKLNTISKYYHAIQLRITRLLSLGAFLLWIIYALRAYNIKRPVFDWLGTLFSESWHLGSIELTLGNIITFLLIIWLTIWITRIVRYIFEDELVHRIQLKRGVPGAISLMIRLILITIGFLIAIAASGVELSSLAILLGALGVGIGFGLQNIFNNLVSGIILAFERPINEGDIIEIGKLTGVVQEIGIRASRIKTADGAEVIIPNGNLISNELINWTLADKKRRAEVLVGVAYGTDPQMIINMLIDIAKDHEEVLDDPAPIALFTGYGDSSLNFRLLFWIADADNRLSMQSKIAILVNEALIKAGIEIPYPQRDIHLRSGS